MRLLEMLKRWWKSTTPRDAERLFGTDETVSAARGVRK